MKPIRLIMALLLAGCLLPGIVLAGDFGWIDDFNLRAEADPAGLRARLEARFHVGNAEIGVVLGNVDSPAHAYIVLRLGEMAHRPVDQVLETYKAEKNRGWGVLAQRLGIKPGSPAFHDLKQRQDLYLDLDHGKGEAQGKDKPKKHQ
jgi:hypothetical protein